MNKMNEQQVHWLTTGMRLGYSACCVMAFINRPLASQRDWPNPWEGTGYIPCRQCAEEPMMTVMGRINSHRDPQLPPFPSDEI